MTRSWNFWTGKCQAQDPIPSNDDSTSKTTNTRSHVEEKMSEDRNPGTMVRLTMEILPMDSRNGGLSRHTGEFQLAAGDLKSLFTLMRKIDDLVREYPAPA